MIRTVEATRYVTPLREGGSLPAIVEADDDGLYVLKFRGAGQGPKALIAELIGGEIGRVLGLPVPEIVFVEVDTALGRSEPDSEVRALIQASGGLNLGLDYLPGSFAYHPGMLPAPGSDLASAIVWFDAFITNVDRTARNTNMLLWHNQLYLIDHGAALYFHHNWDGYLARSTTPFAPIRDHVLLTQASHLNEADARLKPLLSDAVLRDVVALVPETWLAGSEQFATVDEHRAAYFAYLSSRLAASEAFVREAENARAQIV